MRPDSFADRLLLVLGRRAPAYRWTVAPAGFWATVAATMGRTLDRVLPAKTGQELADVEQTSAPTPAAPLRPSSPGRRSGPVQPIVHVSPLVRRRAAVWDLAPQWIAAVAALVIALTAGFFAGRASQLRPPATGGVSPSAITKLPGTEPAGTGQVSASPGTELGSYVMTIPAGYSVPVDETLPVASQFSTTGAGDVGVLRSSRIPNLVPLNGSRIVLVPDSITLSYRSCAASTILASSVAAIQGTSFCLVKRGRVAGLTVVSATDGQVSLHVTIWRD
jgi:hypothetical protein